MSTACQRRCWIIFIVQTSQSWKQQYPLIQFWKTAPRSQRPVGKAIAVVHFPGVLGPGVLTASPSTIALCWLLSRRQRRKIRSLPVNSLRIPLHEQLLIGCTFVTNLCICVSLTLIPQWWWELELLLPFPNCWDLEVKGLVPGLPAQEMERQRENLVAFFLLTLMRTPCAW